VEEVSRLSWIDKGEVGILYILIEELLADAQRSSIGILLLPLQVL
jgi:hypothetical protein